MGRFTIRRGMLGVVLVAGLLGLYRSQGPLVTVVLLWGLTATALSWWGLSRRPRLAGWCFGFLAALVNGGVALILAYLYSIGGFFLGGSGWAALLPLVVSTGSAWALGRRRSRIRRGLLLVLVLIAGTAPLATIGTGWPLRVAFALSRPAFDRLADRIVAGETLTAPEWAGCYRVVATARSPFNGNIALIIDNSPAGRSGFVRVPDPANPMLPLVNLNFNEPVGGPWYYQNED